MAHYNCVEDMLTMSKLSRYVLMRMSVVTVLLAAVVALRPAGLAANDGFSYFGDFRTTVVPYSAAFILYAYTLWKVAETIGFVSTKNKILSWSLRIMTVMLLGLLITPSSLINSIHMIFGTILFALQFVLSIWLAGWWDRNWLNIGLVTLELVGGLISFYYLLKPHGLLLQGQAIFQLAFVCVLARILSRTMVEAD